MWEFSLVFDNEITAQNFKASIIQRIREVNGVITTIFTKYSYSVLLAVPINSRKSIINFLKEKIAENVLLFYKKEYILSKLSFDISLNANMQIFLKALVVFDSDTDKQIIMENLSLKNSLILNSFINFKLKFLKRKWNELVSLANDNEMYFLDDTAFSELIKFLISNLEYRCYAVNIFSKKNCYLLCDFQGRNINDFLVEKSVIYDDSKLLTSLIALNPEKIIVHCNSFVKDNLLKTLYEYFSNRIEICT